jgi:hypothetical protein
LTLKGQIKAPFFVELKLQNNTQKRDFDRSIGTEFYHFFSGFICAKKRNNLTRPPPLGVFLPKIHQKVKNTRNGYAFCIKYY